MNMQHARRRGPALGHAGFTLIELMMVVAVVAILAGIAYPSFMEQVRKGRRADGQAVLLESTQFMERFATENMRFDQSRAGVAVALPTYLTQAPKDGATKYYDIQVQAVAADTYTLRAVPKGDHTGDACGTMTVTNTGQKAAARTDCWRR